MNSKLKLSLGLILILNCQCASKKSTPKTISQRNPAFDSCQFPEDAAPLFSVIKNDEQEIVIELGDFKKEMGIDSNDFNYSVEVLEVKQHRADNYTPKKIIEKKAVEAPLRISIPVTVTGAYKVSLLNKKNQTFWTQKIFAVAKSQRNLTEAQVETLARKYAPVVGYTDDEKYYPVSLEYMFNIADKDPELDQERFRLESSFQSSSFLSSLFGSSLSLSKEVSVRDLPNFLPFYGHNQSILKFADGDFRSSRFRYRFGEKHITVYYSAFENTQFNELVINYHFFYPFDVKTGTVENPPSVAHIFDRESISVVVKTNGSSYKEVYFGAHLANQKMAHKSTDTGVDQEWLGGRVRAPWDIAKMVQNHPYAAAAQGSHGMYPMDGTYAVKFGNLNALTELAGGQNRMIYPQLPETEALKAPSAQAKPYRLVKLPLGNIVSDCQNATGLLAFSGNFVDVLGPENATFPPFTDREENYADYADPNVELFKFGREQAYPTPKH